MPFLHPSSSLSTLQIADHYPHIWSDGVGNVHYADTVDELLAEHDGPRQLDPAALLSILSFEYVCLDRTMIQGVRRLPWMSSVSGKGDRVFHAAPKHGAIRRTPRTLAEHFVTAVEDEFVGYVIGHTKLYLLLSGGMDSRVAAAILRRLQLSGRIDVEIKAITWGPTTSRDVVYAERIAKGYGWDWERLPLTSATYWQNFEQGAIALGAEVDPKHLHRVDWFRQVEKDSVVIAASYGDSVGRAEFGSRRVEDLSELVPRDRYGFLRPAYRRTAKVTLQQDLRAVRTRHGKRSESGWIEVGRQAHYMRRHLCVVMQQIGQWASFHQAFVSPGVVEVVWETHLTDRSDMMYAECLRLLDSSLLDIPWARTGLPYDGRPGVTDRFSRSYHQYGKWLRDEHREAVAAHLFDGTLEGLDAIDIKQVRWMFEEWTKERLEDDTSLATAISALAGLSVFAKRANLVAPERLPTETSHWSTARSRVSQKSRRLTRPLRMFVRDRM